MSRQGQSLGYPAFHPLSEMQGNRRNRTEQFLVFVLITALFASAPAGAGRSFTFSELSSKKVCPILLSIHYRVCHAEPLSKRHELHGS